MNYSAYYHRLFLIAFSLFLPSLAPAVPGMAQVTSDGTLSTTVSQVGSDFTITNGNQVGNNLFHSFSQFSVPTGGSAFFNNAVTIQNIFARVTGGSLSNINGLIQANGTANLFLLNPAGILFGPNASLNMGGSFVASTANSLRFSDGSEFSAVNPAASPLLTVSIPIGLQFGSNPASITNQSQASLGGATNVFGLPAGLTLLSNRTLALVGGAINLTNGNITIPGGRIELGSVGSNSFVGLASIPDGYTLQYNQVQNRQDMQLQDSILDVTGPGGGNIRLWGRNINLSGSGVFAITAGANPGGSIDVQAEQLILDASAIQAVTVTGAQGGDVNLTVNRLGLSNGSVVSAETETGGAGGNLTIQANAIQLVESAIGTETRGNGNAGNVTINTGSLLASNSGIAANTFGRGQGGALRLTAVGRVELLDQSDLTAQASDLNPATGQLTANVGNAGNMEIRADQLVVREGSQIATSTFGNAGKAGDIGIVANTIDLQGRLPLRSSGIFSQVETGAVSQGGNLTLTTQTLNLQDGAQIGTSTRAAGAAGNIVVQASNQLGVQGSPDTGIFAQVEPNATGRGGDIRIDTPQFVLNGGTISATTAGTGQGGNVQINTVALQARNGGQVQSATLGFAPGGTLTIQASASVDLLGTDPLGQFPTGFLTSTRGNAPAGNLNLTTSQLRIQDGARISASSQGTGPGGNLTIRVAQVELTGTAANGEARSGLFVEATGSGRAGNIDLISQSLLLNQRGTISASTASDDGGNIHLQVADLVLMRHGSLISATAGTASGNGNGGNIRIDTTFLVAAPNENSDIVANAFRGRGGNIQITAQSVIGIKPQDRLTPFSDITASSEFGLNGTVVLNTPNTDPSRGLSELPASIVDSSKLIVQGCGVQNASTYSRFVVTGRGGLPADPAALPTESDTLSDLGTPLTPIADRPSNLPTTALADPKSAGLDAPPPLIEAQGWIVDAKGQIILVAQAASQGNSLSQQFVVACPPP
ncbi:MAG: S-layer family protein [Kovacikia sp.]